MDNIVANFFVIIDKGTRDPAQTYKEKKRNDVL